MARGGDGAQFERAQADVGSSSEHCVDTRRERLVHAELRIVRRGLAAGHDRGGFGRRRSALRRCAAAARPARRRDQEMHVALEQYFHVLEAEAERADVAAARSAPPCRAAVDQNVPASPVTRIAAMPQVPTYQLLPWMR